MARPSRCIKAAGDGPLVFVDIFYGRIDYNTNKNKNLI
jgi:hypothetical protein